MSDDLPHDILAAARATQALDAARQVWSTELPGASQDAVALVTALHGQMTKAYATILAGWLATGGGALPRTYVLADEILRLAGRLAATQYLAERKPAADFPMLRLTSVTNEPEAAVAHALALVTAHVRGDVNVVRREFGQHLAPACAPVTAMSFLTALTAAAGICARVGAQAIGVAPAALLAREGVRAAG